MLQPNRLIAILTPLVFAPLAGAVSVFVAKNFPGVDVDQGSVQAIFIAGAGIAFGKAGLWLKGWQEYEKRQDLLPDDVAHDAELEDAMLAEPPVTGPDDELDPDWDEDDDVDLDLELEGDDDLLIAGARME